MAAGKKQSAGSAANRRYTIEEARRGLHGLLREFGDVKKGTPDLLRRGVEIGPHRKGGALLVPEADARATMKRIEELEAELEDIDLVLFVAERLATSTGRRTSAREVITELGFEDIVAELPQ
jgi:hypothetical protein